ncbi:signal peptidase I [Fulvivirgaceae bacterium PWU5]|uniref:Signal peptidase I n=1 Tax=Dawidia cretensis TaxID=2782350 RepID=A0AAP2GUU1_9BACT|nr:signal peptidase I [Dawidia cretensis]MBT1709978.1 signal peptidase I [Dawidia cretensis]
MAAYALMAIGLFMGAISLRTLFFEIYTVPSASMEDALYAGDKILVNKLQYGPWLPHSVAEVPWINLLGNGLPADSAARRRHRLTGFDTIGRDDILLFKHRSDRTYYIKRCAAVPGDHVQIRLGQVWINGQPLPAVPSIRLPYAIRCSDPVSVVAMLHTMNKALQPRRTSDALQVFLNGREKERLLTACNIEACVVDPTLYESYVRASIYPAGKASWSLDNFGPLYVPRAKTTIMLDSTTYDLYADIIHRYENTPLHKLGNKFYCRGQEIKRFTFQKDYYFVLGDNRHNSYDSRHWGFIAAEDVEGKAVATLFSPGRFRPLWRKIWNPL